jgi:hypothetical protein
MGFAHDFWGWQAARGIVAATLQIRPISVTEEKETGRCHIT